MNILVKLGKVLITPASMLLSYVLCFSIEGKGEDLAHYGMRVGLLLHEDFIV